MKTFSTLHVILLLLLLLMYHCSGAQNYLVTTAGDTVRGEIRPVMFGPEKKVQVKNDDGKEMYSLFETKVYAINEELYFPVKGPNGYTFMQLVKSGYLSLYRFQPDNSSIFSGTFLRKADGTGIELPNLGFRKQMTEFLGDCGQVSEAVASGELKKADINEIVDNYNACIEMRTSNVKEDIQQHFEATSVMSLWTDLEETVRSGDNFNNRATVLEMITDIKRRVSRNEKVPNFIVQGLKEALSGRPALADRLNAAIAALEQ